MAGSKIVRFNKRGFFGRRFYFRGVSANGQIVFPSEAYNTAAARDKGIEAARRIFRDGEVTAEKAE
jgi:uncharacterized protein YegP (UPF0339 family)